MRFGTIAVVGVGLIGGSIAAAVRQRRVAGRIIGVGRNGARLDAARRTGLIDVAATDLVAAAEADLVIVCTPVDWFPHASSAVQVRVIVVPQGFVATASP